MQFSYLFILTFLGIGLSLITNLQNEAAKITLKVYNITMTMITLKKVLSSLTIFPLIIASNWGIKTLAKEKKSLENDFLVWRVDPKPGSIYSVYLLGSYHEGKDCQVDPNSFHGSLEFKINSANFWHAFNDAETVIFEIENSELSKQSQYINNLIRQQGTPSSSDTSLRGILDSEAYELLAEKTAAIKFPLDNFADLKPWVFVYKYTSFQSEQTEYKFQCGLDYMTELLAQYTQKNTAGLESLDEHFKIYTDLFVTMDSDEIHQALSAIANSQPINQLFGYSDRKLDSLINTINSGNSEALASYIDDWCTEDVEECESLLFARNRNWVPKIEQLLQRNQDSLVVVGAGHLVGEQNLIQLLKQKGYRVRRFYNSFRLIEE